MKGFSLAAVLFLTTVTWAVADPTVDGKVTAGEYANTKSVIDGGATLYWSPDGSGGLSLAIVAKAKGWAAVGLGAKRMNGAFIYMGFADAAGKAVFSEQMGQGHLHRDSGKKTTDQAVVTQVAGVTTVEFHLPAANLPFTGKTVNFIVAYSNAADLVTPHGDNFDIGSFTLP